jgi:Zn-dependent protease with chaperone function
MQNLEGRIKLSKYRMEQTWQAWVTLLLSIAAAYFISHILMPQLSWIPFMVSVVLVFGITIYMWWMENELQDSLNTIRKQHGLKEIVGKESYFGYLVRL